MSVKPPIPFKELTKTTAKVLKGKVIKGIKKMHAKGFNSPENLLPLFLDIEYPFADGENMLMVFGKLSDWKSYIKGQLTAYSARTLKAYAYTSFSDQDGLVINIAPVKGKAKQEPKLKKAFKALVGAAVGLNVLPDMEENPDLENRADNAPDDDDEDDNEELAEDKVEQPKEEPKEPAKSNPQPQEPKVEAPAKLDSKSVAGLYKETEDLFKQWRNPKLQTAAMTVELHQKLAQLQENADALNPAQTKVFEMMKKAANFTASSAQEEPKTETPQAETPKEEPKEEPKTVEQPPTFEKAMAEFETAFNAWDTKIGRTEEETNHLLASSKQILNLYPEIAQSPHKEKMASAINKIEQYLRGKNFYSIRWDSIKSDYQKWFDGNSDSVDGIFEQMQQFLVENASWMPTEHQKEANRMLSELSAVQRLSSNAVATQSTDQSLDFIRLKDDFKKWQKQARKSATLAAVSATVIQDELLSFVKTYEKTLLPEQTTWLSNALAATTQHTTDQEEEAALLRPYDTIQIYTLHENLAKVSKKLPAKLPNKIQQKEEIEYMLGLMDTYYYTTSSKANLPRKQSLLDALNAKIAYYYSNVLAKVDAAALTADTKLAAQLEELKAELETIKKAIGGVAKMPAIVELNVSPDQLKAATFGDRGTAGEQSASEEAMKKRDATIDEMALELAKLLKSGKAKDDDALFGQVIRWVAAASDSLSVLEGKYTAAAKAVFKNESFLLMDLSACFPPTGLRGAYVMDSLYNRVSPYADLAAAVGAFGTNWLTKKLSGEKADSNEILEGYSQTQLQGLKDGVDRFAVAALGKLSSEQKSFLFYNQRMMASREELEAAKAQGVGAERAALISLKKENDLYLVSLLEIKDDAEFQRKLDLWADNASDAERKAALASHTHFAIKLKEKGGTKLQHAERIINQARYSDEQMEAIKTSEACNELNKIVIDQKAKWGINQWKQGDEVGNQIKAILFGPAGGSPQIGVISRFAPKQLQEFQKPIPADATDEERKELLAAKKKILQEAIAQMSATLKAIKVPTDMITDMEEMAMSNGAKGDAYHKLVKLAEDDNIGLGKDVIAVLEGLDPKGLEFNAIKSKAPTLLKTLQNNILNSRNGSEQWAKIARLLGLTGTLAATNLKDAGLEGKSTKETRDAYKEFRKTNKTRFVTSEETQSLLASVEKAQEDPNYWAQMAVNSFDKEEGGTAMMSLMLRAQKAVGREAFLSAVAAINPHASAYIEEICSSDLSYTKAFSLIQKEDGLFTSTSKSLAKYHKLVDGMDAAELMEYCFNLKEFTSVAINLSYDKKIALREVETAANEEEKATAQKKLDALNGSTEDTLLAAMKKLDISADFTKQLNDVLDEPQAFQIKTKIRDKVVAGLAKLKKETLAKLLPELSEVQIGFLVELIRATSSNEKEGMSNTGTQYHTLSSRGNQKNMAAAEHARTFSQVNNAMNSKEFKQLPKAQKELLQAKMNERLRAAGEVKEQKFKNFEETKKKYDDQIKSVVSGISGALLKAITAPLVTIPFLGGIVEGAVSAVIDSVVDKLLGGDRSGNWGTVFKKMGKNVLINIAKKALSEAGPFLLAGALGEQGFAAVENFKEEVDKVMGKVDATNNNAKGFTKFMQNVRRPLAEMDDFIKDVKISIKDYQASLEETEGLLGIIAAKGIEKGIEKGSEMAMAQLQTQIDSFTRRIRADIDRKGGGFAQFVNVVDKLSDVTSKTMMLYNAAKAKYDIDKVNELREAKPGLKDEELLEELRGLKGTEFGDMDDKDWELAKRDISQYKEAFEMLQETREEFYDALSEDWLQPAQDKLMGTEEFDAEVAEEAAEPAQLSTDSPKKSIENLREALKAQGSKLPPFLSELVKAL